MPNWAEGNMRIRGKRENIINFLKRELCMVIPNQNPISQDELKPVRIEAADPSGESIWLFRDPNTQCSFYFRGSKRQFIHLEKDQTELEVYFSEGRNENKDTIIVLDNFAGAWDIDTETFKQMAIRNKVDIRIFVWECGLEWSTIQTFYKTGAIDTETRQYADYLWDSPMPQLGG